MTTLAAPADTAAPPRHRPALDGIRALAVAAVVTYHLGADWLPGGFLGVDLFFVLSGFLITGILIDEVNRDGRISFPSFFARRARRLLPALYLLILAVCGWAAFVAAPEAIGDLRGAALAALFYVANWFFIFTGQSYFIDMVGPSPLEHTWSLAIEEQYYLVWPLVVLLLLRKAHPRVLTIVTFVLILLSTAFMAWTFDSGDPSVAYFGTFTRIHELLVGALLAIMVKRGLALPASLRWTAWIPLALLLAAFATVSDVGAFYYRGGSLLISIVVAWLLLALGAGPAGGGPTRLFSLPPIVWVGLVSYGIYLWHWPLLLWLTPTSTGLSGLGLAALRIGATVAIAALSFYLIEKPIRRGAIGKFALSPRRLAIIVPVAMAVMAVTIFGATTRATSPELESTEAPTALTGAAVPVGPVVENSVVAMAGDSIPKELMPYLEAEAASRGWSVLPLAFGGCSVTGTYQVDVNGDPFVWSKRCSEGFAEMQNVAITKFDPDVVVWYSNRERFPVSVYGSVLEAGTPEHRARLDSDLEAAYRRLSATGADIVIVLPVPKAPPTRGLCAAGVDSSTDCAMDDAYYASFAELTDAFEELAAAHPDRVTLVRVGDLLCPAGRDCPELEQDGVPVRPDGIHFSPEGAAWYVPLLFDRAGLLPLESVRG